MANPVTKHNLLDTATAIHAALVDAKVSLVMFQNVIAEANPGPGPLRIFFKSFLYSIKEIMDYSKKFKHSRLAPINKMIFNARQSNPLLKYVAEARNTLAHDPMSFLETNGGWVKIAQAEQNPDGTFNFFPYKYEHLPGNLSIKAVKTIEGVTVPLPNPTVSKYGNQEINKMMDETILAIEIVIEKMDNTLATIK